MSRNYRAGGTEGRPKGRDEWRTPPELYAALNQEFRFALDAACTSQNCLAPLGLYRDYGKDAFEDPWSGGPVWCNPPYSGQGGVRPWIERATECETVAVLLLSADTSTRWWHEVVAQRASEVRFVVGRLRFLMPNGDQHYTKRKGGGLTTPSAIVVFRPEGGPPSYSYIRRNGEPC